MKEFINIALPKGRLGEKAYQLLKNSGFECPAIEDPGRKLIFENPEKGVRYFWVKPSDVAIYVERGAAHSQGRSYLVYGEVAFAVVRFYIFFEFIYETLVTFF